MWRRWLIFTVVVPVIAFANTGCITGGATEFIADAVVQGTTPPDLVYVRFKYDVSDGKMRIKGHIKDPNATTATSVVVTGRTGVFMRLQGVISPFTQGSDFNCMGAVVHYIVENPDREYDGDIVDMNNNPTMPNEGTVFVDACDDHHDQDIHVGDRFDAQAIDGPYATYVQQGTVVKGSFECESPDPCSAPI